MNTARKKILEKFKEQVEYLISEGIVANQQEIVDAIGWNKSQMSQAMKGIKPIPLPVYRKFTQHYKLSTLFGDMPVVEVDDWKEYLIKNAIDNKAMSRVILMALAEILASQRSESVTKVLSELTRAVEQERASGL